MIKTLVTSPEVLKQEYGKLLEAGRFWLPIGIYRLPELLFIKNIFMFVASLFLKILSLLTDSSDKCFLPRNDITLVIVYQQLRGFFVLRRTDVKNRSLGKSINILPSFYNGYRLIGQSFITELDKSVDYNRLQSARNVPPLTTGDLESPSMEHQVLNDSERSSYSLACSYLGTTSLVISREKEWCL